MRVFAALSMLPLASALRHMPGEYNGNGGRSAGELVQDKVQKCAEEKGWEGGAWMNCENEIVCKNKKNKKQWIKHNCQWHQQEWGECWQKNHCRDLPVYIQVEQCVNGDWDKWQQCELEHKCHNKKYMKKALKGCDNEGSYSTGSGQCWLKDHCQWLEDEVNGGDHHHHDNQAAQTFENDYHHDDFNSFDNQGAFNSFDNQGTFDSFDNKGSEYDFGSADHFNNQAGQGYNNYGAGNNFHSFDNHANFGSYNQAGADNFGSFNNQGSADHHNYAAGAAFTSYMY